MTNALHEYYKRNFEAFARQQLKISTSRPGELIPLTLTVPQKMLYERIMRQKAELGYIRYTCCKSRQSKMSTFAQALCYWMTIFTPQFYTLLIANDKDTTKDIFAMASRFTVHLDEGVRPMTDRSNIQELVFQNPDKRKRFDDPGLGSRIVFQCATNLTAGTGGTRHAVHLSEISKWDHDSVELLFSSIMPGLHLVPGTVGIKESTPYVGGDDFRAMCEEARSGLTDEVWFFIPWFFDEHNQLPLKKGERFVRTGEEKRIVKLAAKGQPRDQVPPVDIGDLHLNWRRKKIIELKSENMFAQEYPLTFEDGWIKLDAAIFDHGILGEIKRRDICPPKRFVDVQPGPKINTIKLADNKRDCFSHVDYIAIWQEPIPGVIYDIGVDVSVGATDSADWSVAEVFRRDTREQVAELHLHVDPQDLGLKLYWLGTYYNTGQLIVEMNGPGFATHGKLAAMAYPYIYIWRHRERDVPSLSTYRGFKTQHDSKNLIVSNAMHRFNSREWRLHSQLLWKEMHDFVQVRPGEYRASTGNDDAVMALMLCNQGAEDETFGEEGVEAQAVAMAHQAVAGRNIALQDDLQGPTQKDERWDRLIADVRGVV